ncbi:DNA methylase [Caballeronia sp. SBC1]|nr:DNA methylase [Caballeronia sp. SBC1]
MLAGLADNSVDAIVTDAPYAINIKRTAWDKSGVAFDPSVWAQCLRVLRPGGHMLAFGHARTYHRLAVAVEDAGFEVRDQIAWVYGQGYPKSTDVSKAIDKAAGKTRALVPRVDVNGVAGTDARKNGWVNSLTKTVRSDTRGITPEAQQWEGWGTNLKPSHEPILMARKPLDGTLVHNVLTHGTGGINVDACRADLGRFPANLVHDASPEVMACFPDVRANIGGTAWGTASAARVFYCAKPNARDKGEDNDHDTVKPTDLMRYLCRLVTPPGGTVLDPFMGSGSTGKAAMAEGFKFVGIDLMAEYVEIARRRIAGAL